MKIYITEETKKEIEDKIIECETYGVMNELNPRFQIWSIYKELLSKAIVLPVKKSWRDTPMKYSLESRKYLIESCPNGIIIKPE